MSFEVKLRSNISHNGKTEKIIYCLKVRTSNDFRRRISPLFTQSIKHSFHWSSLNIQSTSLSEPQASFVQNAGLSGGGAAGPFTLPGWSGRQTWWSSGWWWSRRAAPHSGSGRRRPWRTFASPPVQWHPSPETEGGKSSVTIKILTSTTNTDITLFQDGYGVGVLTWAKFKGE